MKIGWCAPVNEGSGITRFSGDIAAELSRRGHDVTILASDLAGPVAAAVNASDVAIEPIEASHAGAYDPAFDAVFYNIGDHLGFHARILDIIEAVPGIGIFHDASILNLFLGWADHVGLSEAARENHILAYCGEVGLRRFRARNGETDWFQLCASLPMIEWLAGKVGAAMVHAEHYAARVEAACQGPVARADLAYRPAILPSPPAMPFGRDDDLVITTIGVVNANKCYSEVIEAIGASDTLRRRAVYRIFGDSQPGARAKLEMLAAARGVRVAFPESRDAAALTRCLESTDIICALRRPILEGASASAIEGLMSGRPVVVADAGFYAGLSDAYVTKVPAEVPIPALTAALERLAADGERSRARGLAARAWAIETFSAAQYCDALDRLMADFIEAKPLLRLGRDVGRNLARFGFRRDDPAIATIAGAAHELFVAPKT